MLYVEGLNVYKKSLSFADKVYSITRKFPKEELYGLVMQMRRAAVSISSNISEGGSRVTDGELKQFLGNARGSTAELKTQIVISKSQGFIDEKDYEEMIEIIDEIHKMLTGLIKKYTKS